MGNILTVDSYDSPIGRMWIISRLKGIVRIALSSITKEMLIRKILDEQGPVEFLEGGSVNQFFVQELDAYFSGVLRMFQSRPLMQGTSFQNQVWQGLCTIPYGTVKTYGEVASMIGNPRACRAVGQANRQNPLPILVPCHRVVSHQGLGGYSSGIAIKQWLLNHEASSSNT
jgi:O-6-methylguanine DNA methyltransferase